MLRKLGCEKEQERITSFNKRCISFKRIVEFQPTLLSSMVFNGNCRPTIYLGSYLEDYHGLNFRGLKQISVWIIFGRLLWLEFSRFGIDQSSGINVKFSTQFVQKICSKIKLYIFFFLIFLPPPKISYPIKYPCQKSISMWQ